jgi:hypothetical protein
MVMMCDQLFVVTVDDKLRELREVKNRTYTTNNLNKHTFYKRIENLSDITRTFNDNETQHLNEGLKYTCTTNIRN